nr:hypothetical protein [Herbaspirillum sp. ASV7]
MRFLRLSLLALTLLYVPVTKADLADNLSKLVGYMILDTKTIKGWYDDDGKANGSFEGCNHGRVIVFDDGKVLTCSQYGYQYAYRPSAVILVKPITYQNSTIYDYKMVVEDEIYDMRR